MNDTTENTNASSEVQAVIYSTPVCHFCQAAKEFFKENNVSYEDINVAENAEERQKMIEMTGQMGVPVIKIGDDVVIGFDEGKVKELLGM
jgi:glutaredoxin-like YruB-family protein